MAVSSNRAACGPRPESVLTRNQQDALRQSLLLFAFYAMAASLRHLLTSFP